MDRYFSGNPILMKQKESTEFSWTLLFIVTASSFLIFSLCLKLLDGSFSQAGMFFKIGLITAALCIINGISYIVVTRYSRD
jgi:hypothetical protein